MSSNPQGASKKNHIWILCVSDWHSWAGIITCVRLIFRVLRILPRAAFDSEMKAGAEDVLVKWEGKNFLYCVFVCRWGQVVLFASMRENRLSHLGWSSRGRVSKIKGLSVLG
jgi:hypothetical protein